MRNQPLVLHLDLDAFYASVEQRDKPSLRGKPVVVGGVGSRGVVATASYEARVHGVRSAMSTAEARSRCPHAAFLSGRFDAYRAASAIVMERLRALSPLVEPLSLDEAFVDLAAGEHRDLTVDHARDIATTLRADVAEATGGLRASVGIGTSKLLAKIASELAKPDGLYVVEPGTEVDLLRPMQVTVIPGVGPATAGRLRANGVETVAQLQQLALDEVVRILGTAHGSNLYALARARDDRPVMPQREAKSVSVEDTFEHDLVERSVLHAIVDRQARHVGERLRKARLSGRTVTIKIRSYDFTTHTRAATLAGPTDRDVVVARVAKQLLDEHDTSAGVRLLGVGVSGLADWVQDDLFDLADPEPTTVPPAPSGVETGATAPDTPADDDRWQQRAREVGRRFVPGADVHHDELGDGWVWGSGLGRVTVRFETADTGPGPVRTFREDDPALCLTSRHADTNLE